MTQVFDAYASYYDLLYRDKDYLAEAEYVASLIHKHNPRATRILELGCGTGQHAVHLATLKHQILGIDLSQPMISKARANIPVGLEERISYLEGDIRNIRSAQKFDAVISLFHVASYQTTNTDIHAMIQTAAKHLSSGGIFIFDFWYGPAVLTEIPKIRIKRYVDNNYNLLRIAEPVLRENDNIVDVNYTILATDKRSSTTTQISETHCMRYYFLPELQLLLESAGFIVDTASEWMTAAPLSLKTWNSSIVTIKR